MTDFIKNKLKLFVHFSLIVLLLGACTSKYSIKNFFRSPEKRTLNLYTNYIKNISSAEFTLSSFKSNSKLCNQSIYAKKLLSNCNSDNNVCIQKLIENKLLFFTSKETGDPAYLNLALYNSEMVYKSHFENNYDEISERIFDQVLDSLEETSLQDKQHSFRKYYYLFEYLKQKELNI
jgi:hypothetical protein